MRRTGTTLAASIPDIAWVSVTPMLRVLALATACVLAAEGGFGFFATQLGAAGYGDHLAAITIAWLISPFLTGVQT